MDDLISRQAAITAIQNAYCDTEGGDDKCAVWKNVGLTEALHIMQDLPSAQQWIPVSERLPEKPYGCLVTVWDEEPMTGEMFENLLPYFVGWDGEQWNDGDGQQCPFEVIAWMPLPEPYERREE